MARGRPAPPTGLRPAAQYLRMSRESQRYSPAQQAEAIARYAAAHGLEIVRTYLDHGRSGVTARNRTGLQALLADVVGGRAKFATVLVYDVSRWGRFQNPDQSGHYEFLCADAGVRVEYCAEGFANDDSLAAVIQKTVRRVMAAEFSRDLSEKTARGQAFLARLGYWQGGPPGYGLRRQVFAADGAPGPVLERGEQKAIHGHHVRLVPGPRREVLVVNRIFRLFAREGLSRQAIAARLNAEAEPSSDGRPWTWERVTAILASRRYVGDIEFHRTRGELGGPRRRTARADWGVARRALTPIVPGDLFAAAQARLAARAVDRSTAGMLEAARRVHAREGRLTARLLDAEPGLPSAHSFERRFGGLRGLARAIGHPAEAAPRDTRARLGDAEMLARLSRLLEAEGYLSGALIRADRRLPGPACYQRRFGSLEAAYARVGYPLLSGAAAASPVGRARLAAASWARRRAAAVDAAAPEDP